MFLTIIVTFLHRLFLLNRIVSKYLLQFVWKVGKRLLALSYFGKNYPIPQNERKQPKKNSSVIIFQLSEAIVVQD